MSRWKYNKRPIERTIEPNNNFGFAFWIKTTIFLSLGIYLLLISPLSKSDIFSGHDSGAIIIYAKLFHTAITQGQFPVRVIDWVTPAINQPLFNFYQPGFYYLVELVQLLGVGVVGSINIVVLLLWFASAIFMFLFVKCLLDDSFKATFASVVAAGMYAFAPYHIADVYVRAAMPEFTALAFIPALFWATASFVKTGKNMHLVTTGLFLSMVLLGHPPTFLMFSIPLLFFIILLFIVEKKYSRLVPLTLAMVCGVLVSGFYLFPSLLEGDIIQRQWLTLGYYNFHQHFVCPLQLVWSSWGYGTSQPGCSDGFSFQLGIIHVLGLLTAISLLAYRIYRKAVLTRREWLLVYFLAVTSFGVFFTLEISSPFWENTPYIALLQYPWRFIAVVIFALSVGIGLLLKPLLRGNRSILFFLLAIGSIPLVYGSYLHPFTYYPQSVFEKGDSIRITPEFGYFPKGVSVLPATANIPKNLVVIEAGSATVQLQNSLYTTKKWDIHAKSEAVLRLFVHYFPGWHVELNGKETAIRHENEYGFIEVTAPEGSYQAHAFYTQTAVEKYANWSSLAGLLLLFVLAYGTPLLRHDPEE